MLSWQGEVVKIDFYGESEGREGAFKLKRRGEHLKEKRKVRASFERIGKKEKTEKWKSRGRLIAFYEIDKREKQDKKLDYDWTQEN